MMQKSLPLIKKYFAPLLNIAVGILAYNGFLYLLGQAALLWIGLYIGFVCGVGVFLLTTTFLERNTPPQARPNKPEGRVS